MTSCPTASGLRNQRNAKEAVTEKMLLSCDHFQNAGEMRFIYLPVSKWCEKYKAKAKSFTFFMFPEIPKGKV